MDPSKPIYFFFGVLLLPLASYYTCDLDYHHRTNTPNLNIGTIPVIPRPLIALQWALATCPTYNLFYLINENQLFYILLINWLSIYLHLITPALKKKKGDGIIHFPFL